MKNIFGKLIEKSKKAYKPVDETILAVEESRVDRLIDELEDELTDYERTRQPRENVGSHGLRYSIEGFEHHHTSPKGEPRPRSAPPPVRGSPAPSLPRPVPPLQRMEPERARTPAPYPAIARVPGSSAPQAPYPPSPPQSSSMPQPTRPYPVREYPAPETIEVEAEIIERREVTKPREREPGSMSLRGFRMEPLAESESEDERASEQHLEGIVGPMVTLPDTAEDETIKVAQDEVDRGSVVEWDKEPEISIEYPGAEPRLGKKPAAKKKKLKAKVKRKSVSRSKPVPKAGPKPIFRPRPKPKAKVKRKVKVKVKVA